MGWLQVPDSTRAGTLAEAVVDLAAIAHNTRLLADTAGAALMAVVKADGFGHGMVPVAQTALAHGATWLGVTSRAEALALRAAGVRAPTLSWLHLPDEDFAPLIAAEVDISCATEAQLRAVAAGAAGLGTTARVQLKVDTGLTRGGTPVAGWPKMVALARQLERAGQVRVCGVWSHLAGADDPGDPSVGQQVTAFEAALALAHAGGLRPALRHLANSAAIVDLPGTHYDLVRAGIALYGAQPIAGRRYDLRPAMTLRARALLVKRVPAGTGVSYNHEYRTDRETTLVLVPLGYADGVPRVTGGRGQVWLAGRRYPMVGRVAMDQFVVDVGDTGVAVGDEVVLFGPGDNGEPTVADWAGWAGTNAHEILTGVGARVPRRYLPAPVAAAAPVGLAAPVAAVAPADTGPVGPVAAAAPGPVVRGSHRG